MRSERLRTTCVFSIYISPGWLEHDLPQVHDREPGLGDGEVPADPILFFRPVADRVFVRVGFVLHDSVVNRQVAGVPQNGTVLGLPNGLCLR